jgi:hypothetical protein
VRTGNSYRYFGGLAVMIKNKLKPYIKMVNNTNPDYQWVKLKEKSFLFLRGYLYLLCVLSPSCSANTQSLKHDILDCIEKDI